MCTILVLVGHPFSGGFFLCPCKMQVHFPFLYKGFIMDVRKWIQDGEDYDSGVMLLSKLSNKKHLIRTLSKKETDFYRRKLKYELMKYLENDQVKSVQKVKSKPKKITTTLKVEKIKEASSTLSKLKSKPISAYPVELHETYKLRIETFYEASSLKIQLNEVPEEDHETALKLQLQIWYLLQQNSKHWKILEYYERTKQILPTKSKKDFSKLTPMEIVKQRQRLYVNRSKRIQTIENKQIELNNELNEAKRERLINFIIRKKEELQHIQNDIDLLTDLIKHA